jgi:hypothetical protein
MRSRRLPNIHIGPSVPYLSIGPSVPYLSIGPSVPYLSIGPSVPYLRKSSELKPQSEFKTNDQNHL